MHICLHMHWQREKFACYNELHLVSVNLLLWYFDNSLYEFAAKLPITPMNVRINIFYVKLKPQLALITN